MTENFWIRLCGIHAVLVSGLGWVCVDVSGVLGCNYGLRVLKSPYDIPLQHGHCLGCVVLVCCYMSAAAICLCVHRLCGWRLPHLALLLVVQVLCFDRVLVVWLPRVKQQIFYAHQQRNLVHSGAPAVGARRSEHGIGQTEPVAALMVQRGSTEGQSPQLVAGLRQSTTWRAQVFCVVGVHGWKSSASCNFDRCCAAALIVRPSRARSPEPAERSPDPGLRAVAAATARTLHPSLKIAALLTTPFSIEF